MNETTTPPATPKKRNRKKVPAKKPVQTPGIGQGRPRNLNQMCTDLYDALVRAGSSLAVVLNVNPELPARDARTAFENLTHTETMLSTYSREFRRLTGTNEPAATPTPVKARLAELLKSR